MRFHTIICFFKVFWKKYISIPVYIFYLKRKHLSFPSLEVTVRCRKVSDQLVTRLASSKSKREASNKHTHSTTFAFVQGLAWCDPGQMAEPRSGRFRARVRGAGACLRTQMPTVGPTPSPRGAGGRPLCRAPCRVSTNCTPDGTAAAASRGVWELSSGPRGLPGRSHSCRLTSRTSQAHRQLQKAQLLPCTWFYCQNYRLVCSFFPLQWTFNVVLY